MFPRRFAAASPINFQQTVGGKVQKPASNHEKLMIPSEEMVVVHALKSVLSGGANVFGQHVLQNYYVELIATGTVVNYARSQVIIRPTPP